MRTDYSALPCARSGQTSRFATQNSFEQTILIHHKKTLNTNYTKNQLTVGTHATLLNMEKISQKTPQHGEVLAPEVLGRGEIRSISDEITFYEEQASRPGSHRYAYEVNWLAPLHAASHEGWNFILRLPRVNEAACVRKYGGIYDKVEAYIEFVKTLAQRNNIDDLKYLWNSEWLFERKRDAELLARKLIEKQEKAELEFEVIEGGQPTQTGDQTDTIR